MRSANGMAERGVRMRRVRAPPSNTGRARRSGRGRRRWPVSVRSYFVRLWPIGLTIRCPGSGGKISLRENFKKLAPWQRAAVPKNVWVGITCEDQEHFDRRWQHLCGISSLRFISYEPALGPLMLGDARPDWLLCGGESGAGARYMDPGWARSIRDQCAARGIAFFMKQMTKKRPIPDDLFVRQFPNGGSKGL